MTNHGLRIRGWVARALAAATMLSLLVAGTVTVGGAGAAPPPTAQPGIVNPVPGTNTPAVGDGTIKTMIMVGNEIIVGGTFTTVTSPGGSPVARNRVFAFDATTGAVDAGFVPQVDDEVDALLAGPTAGTVYLAGKFKTVNGLKSKSLVLVNLADGSTVKSFVVPAMDGIVTDLAVVGGRLYLAGTFVHLNASTHAGLATLNPTSGAIDPYANLQFSGHHNYPKNGNVAAGVGLLKFDVTPDGRTMVAIGNFTSASGLARDQIARIDLSGPSAAVSTTWNTNAYTPPCYSGSFDSYVRGVQFSPDGSYFVVTTTGGYYGGSFQACDAAARWETGSTGSDVQPTWVDFTGTDSLYSVTVTGSAVYVGGHQRWLNNPYGQDNAKPGAVPRPGLAALDPTTGVPLDWNPGRNPRGHGAEALLATPQGLYVGSDTTFIGNYRYRRDRIAFFPLAGGTTIAPARTGDLPGNVYLGGRLSTAGRGTSLDDLSVRPYSGSTAGAASVIPGTGIAWSKTRGAFMVNGVLYYGLVDGNLYRRTFNGSTFGAATLIDPYDDPTWANVATGSGSSVYRGAKSGFYGEIPNVTGMFFSNGLIYYTLQGDSTLHSRPFSTDSGIVGPTRSDVPVGINWSDAGGMFIAGGQLFWATRSDGKLHAVGFANGTFGSSVANVSGPGIDGADWRTHALFLYAS